MPMRIAMGVLAVGAIGAGVVADPDVDQPWSTSSSRRASRLALYDLHPATANLLISSGS